MPNPIRKTTLKNGVRVITKHMPHIHSVSMGVWVSVGARDETPSQNGISHLIEHMLFKGTHTRSGYQIAKEFDAIGGHTNAFTSMENTCYHAKVMDTHLATMIEILSDIFLNSVFATDDVAKERPVILQEINMVEDNPDEYVHVLSGRNFWGDNPLGWSILGTRENVAGFTRDKIKDFFNCHYLPERIIISAAGNLNHPQFVDQIGPLFEALPIGNHRPRRQTPHSNPGCNVHFRDLEQAHICVSTQGLAIADPQRFAFSLMNTILGGNMSSRLFQEIRERQGLAYSVYSFMTSYVDAGMFGAYVGVDPQQTEKTIDLVLAEMRKLKNTAVEDAELHDAKEYTKGSLLLTSESSDNQMARLAQNEMYFDRYIPLQEIVEKIDAVTKEDICSLAAELLQSNYLTLTVLGPISETASFQSRVSQ